MESLLQSLLHVILISPFPSGNSIAFGTFPVALCRFSPWVSLSFKIKYYLLKPRISIISIDLAFSASLTLLKNFSFVDDFLDIFIFLGFNIWGFFIVLGFIGFLSKISRSFCFSDFVLVIFGAIIIGSFGVSSFVLIFSSSTSFFTIISGTTSNLNSDSGTV